MLLDLARRAWNFPGRLSHRVALSKRSFQAPPGAPVVAFGAAEPRDGELIHGGRVKLLHLKRAFEHSESRFNFLYLVSSAMPPHALDLVRWAHECGAKFVWNQNGVGFPAWAGARFAAVNRPMKELLTLADFVVYQSEFCKTSADRWLGPARCPSKVLFNPVDLDAFSPAPEPPSVDCWRLLAAGTHHQAARILGAIETVRNLRAAGRNAVLTIAGELRWPDAQREVREALDRWNIEKSVEFRPPFTQAEAAGLLRSAHVLLHLKYHDPCPTMVIESLACGVPVFGSRSGGMPELLGKEGGELIDVPVSWEKSSYPGAEEMAVAVERIMANWPERSRAARLRAERLFSSTKWVQDHGELFREILSVAN